MLKKTMGLIVLAFVVLAFTAFMPAAADEDLEFPPGPPCPVWHVSGTEAEVQGACCTEAPIVKAKWEQRCFEFCSDPTQVEQGLGLAVDDAYEQSDLVCGPGGKRIAKFLPTCDPCKDRCVEIWAVCADKIDGVEDVDNVYYTVTGPCGDVVFTGCMEPVDDSCWSRLQLRRAWLRGVVTTSSCEYTLSEMLEEMNDPPCGKVTAGFWKTQIEIPYCWAAGCYEVKVWCDDGALCDRMPTMESEPLENCFKMIRCPCCDVDFCGVDYGTISVCGDGYCPGDKIFQMQDGKPTLKNLGNVNIGLKVAQDDMGLGSPCAWNVEYDGAVGGEDPIWFDPSWHRPDICQPGFHPGDEAAGNPGFWNLLPGCVTRCQNGEVCFSVHVKHATCGDLTGCMVLKCTDLGQDPCCDCDGNHLDTMGNPAGGPCPCP